MKRIAIAVKTTEGGRWILPQIAEARRRGIEVVVILPEGSGRLADEVTRLTTLDSGLSLRRSPFAFKFAIRPSTIIDLWRLHRLLRSLDVDAVLYHLYATALAIRFATIGLRARRVHMVAGPLYLESRQIRIAEQFLARRDTVIICGSAYTAARYSGLGIPSDRLVEIPYGVNTAIFAPTTPAQRERARVQLAVPSAAFVAVMVAYVYAPKRLVFAGRGIKGHADILDSWAQLHRQFPQSRLLLVGAGFDAPGETYRQELMASLPGGLEGNGIMWLDSLDDVRVAYEAADVSVSPSLSENHGAALEASAMGVPSIVSSAGALPETITGESGWVHVAGSVPDLVRALTSAHQAWANGLLGAKGEAARAFMLQHFDQASSARHVINVVTSTHQSVGSHAS